MLINANKPSVSANSREYANENANANDLVYPELSYKLMGALFAVQNALGPNHPEKHYQKAIEIELLKTGIPFVREKYVSLGYEGTQIGKYFIDFVIDRKIALETKTIDFFTRKEWRQVRDYLDADKLKLALLVNFSTPKLTYRRIINPRVILL